MFFGRILCWVLTLICVFAACAANSIAPHWLFEAMSVGLSIAFISLTMAIIQRDMPEVWKCLTVKAK